MAVTIKKGAIIPAKQQMVIEWDGIDPGLGSEDLPTGGTAWRVKSGKVGDFTIESLKDAVIHLSDGEIVRIDQAEYNKLWLGREVNPYGVAGCGNGLVWVSLNGDYTGIGGSSRAAAGSVWFFKDETRYVTKLEMPNWRERWNPGHTVREVPWCRERIVHHSEDNGQTQGWDHFIYDEDGNVRQLVAGRAYRVVWDGEEHLLQAAGFGPMYTTLKLDDCFMFRSYPGGQSVLWVYPEGAHRLSITEIVEEDVPAQQAAAVADAAGDAPTADEYNALLASLRNAGILAT